MKGCRILWQLPWHLSAWSSTVSTLMALHRKIEIAPPSETSISAIRDQKIDASAQNLPMVSFLPIQNKNVLESCHLARCQHKVHFLMREVEEKSCMHDSNTSCRKCKHVDLTNLSYLLLTGHFPLARMKRENQSLGRKCNELHLWRQRTARPNRRKPARPQCNEQTMERWSACLRNWWVHFLRFTYW